MDDFKFVLNGRRSIISDKAIIEGVKAFAAAHPGQPTTAIAFNEWPHKPCSDQTARFRFGSWDAVLKAAGVEGGRPRRYSTAQLFDNLEKVWRHIGRPPGRRQLQLHGSICGVTYRVRFGSLRRACELLARFHSGRLTREELLNSEAPPVRTARPYLRTATRWAILNRDEFRCVLCGANPAIDKSITLQVDHIQPISRGGNNDPSNLRTLCKACNRGKSNK